MFGVKFFVSFQIVPGHGTTSVCMDGVYNLIGWGAVVFGINCASNAGKKL